MVSALISRTVILIFGTLYPAYKSYKAVKTKNVKEYVKWMMYWIVFALFSCVETFTDLFVAWLPFYYELKIVFVLWLLSPATKGASILYRKFVHPQLSKREEEIDAHLDRVTDQGYSAIVGLGQKAIKHATNVVVTTAIKGQAQLAEQIKRSYSAADVSTDETDSAMVARNRRDLDEFADLDDEEDNRLIEERYQREMSEKDIDTKQLHRRKMQTQRSNTLDLDDIDEHDDSSTSSTKGQKETSHYGTLPRTRSTRSSARISATSHQRHSYHE